MSARARSVCLLAVIAICSTTGCSPSPPAPGPPPAPDADRVRADLPGQSFAFYDDADGVLTWTVSADEVRRVEVVDTTARAGGVRVRARVVLASASRTIRGLLDLDYERAGDGWQLRAVDRAGGNFAVADDGFVLFDVAGVPSDSTRPDRLRLDVIGRFQDGAWTAPLDGVRRRVRTVLDSAVADSVRWAALDRLEADVGRRWAPAGLGVRVWAPGRAARAVTVDSADVSVDGCEFVVGWARGTAGDGALGSTSSVLGGDAVSAPSGREVRALDRLARRRLAARGGDVRRLRSTGALAADLDGDGTAEVVGTYAVGADTLGDRRAPGVLVAGRMDSDGARLVLERRPAEGFDRFTLVGVADLDGDGAAEVVVREEGYEVYRYRVVTWRGGRFVDAFRGGGGGC